MPLHTPTATLMHSVYVIGKVSTAIIMTILVCEIPVWQEFSVVNVVVGKV